MLNQAFSEQLSAATDPRDLSGLIYRHCAPLTPISKIDLICNERAALWNIACFVETPSLHDASQLAQHLGATVFGVHGVVFEMPRPAAFACAPFLHDGDAQLPVRVVFNCMRA